MEIRRLAEVAPTADPKFGDFFFGSGRAAFRTNARFRIVGRSRELFEGESAFSAGIIEKRHPFPF